MRRRFFVEAFDEHRATLAGETAHHLGKVLRAEPGQLYELSDGTSVWLGKIEFAGKDRIDFSLLEPIPIRASPLDKTLFLAIVKFDAFEWALEKATELGVNRIVPLACARSERGLLAAAGKRAERWKKIVFESSQQSRRVRLPVIDPVARVDAAFSETESKLKIMFSERETAQSLKHILAETNSCTVAMAIGPEGGWTEQEFAAGKHAGFVEASLGSLILRTETAVTAGLAALNYALDAESE